MVKFKRHELAAEAARRNRQQLADIGSQVRTARIRRRLTQELLARRVCLSRSAVSAIERGLGGGHTLDTWQRVAVALELPLRVELGRDWLEPPSDAGHLGVQELVLRLGRATGYSGSFELTARPLDSAHSTDVGLLDPVRRRLLLIECWNAFGDLGAAARSTNRKHAEAEALAIARGGDRPFRVSTCWVVRATRRNRELAARYPEILAARFRGSSDLWVRALMTGSEPPAEPGLVWCDLAATRIFAWRPRRARRARPGQ